MRKCKKAPRLDGDNGAEALPDVVARQVGLLLLHQLELAAERVDSARERDLEVRR